MPKALEQKLKRKVAGKDWSKEHKDAYVYGALRNTGWKPKREVDKSHKTKLQAIDMNIVRLQQINKKLDEVCFQYDNEDDRRRSLLGGAAKIGGVAVAGTGAAYGGYKLHGAIRARQAAMNTMPLSAGGKSYLDAASNLAAGKLQAGADIARQGSGAVGKAAMSGLKTAGSSIAKTSGSAWQAILKKLGRAAVAAG